MGNAKKGPICSRWGTEATWMDVLLVVERNSFCYDCARIEIAKLWDENAKLIAAGDALARHIGTIGSVSPHWGAPEMLAAWQAARDG